MVTGISTTGFCPVPDFHSCDICLHSLSQPLKQKTGKTWEELFFSLTCRDLFFSRLCFLSPHISTQVFTEPTFDLLLMFLLERQRGLLMLDF